MNKRGSMLSKPQKKMFSFADHTLNLIFLERNSRLLVSTAVSWNYLESRQNRCFHHIQSSPIVQQITQSLKIKTSGWIVVSVSFQFVIPLADCATKLYFFEFFERIKLSFVCLPQSVGIVLNFPVWLVISCR